MAGFLATGDPGLWTSSSSPGAIDCLLFAFFGLLAFTGASRDASSENDFTSVDARHDAAACLTGGVVESRDLKRVFLRESKSLILSKYVVSRVRFSKHFKALICTTAALSEEATFRACFHTSLDTDSSAELPTFSNNLPKALNTELRNPA